MPMRNLFLLLLLMTVRTAAQPAPSEPIRQRLIREVEEISRNFDGVIGVAIRDLKTGEEILVNGDRIFPTGSSIKIPILIELHRQAATGSLVLSETVAMTERTCRSVGSSTGAGRPSGGRAPRAFGCAGRHA
ncbi:MAG: hypothetical protein EBZ36_11855, partial [Acidobacteria bacterium]|nr:hypothetical protein [Acidobacteriota bacterium]